MKKILFICCVMFSTLAFSRENVTIVYAFGAGDSIANYARALVSEANSSQNKYTFLFDVKPGAGNSIAANYVKNTPNTILNSSSAFFVRPVFYPAESYNIDDFKELMPQCDGPMVVASSKYKSWGAVPTTVPVTVGIAGLGSTTHLIALQLVKKYPNMILVPYKSVSEIIMAVFSKQIDLGITFVSDAEQWTQKNSITQVYVLGATGAHKVKNYKLLINSGFPMILADLNLSHQLIVPKSLNDDKFKEWRTILVKAAKADSVKKAYAVDNCHYTSDVTDADLNSWFETKKHNWTKIIENSKINSIQ